MPDDKPIQELTVLPADNPEGRTIGFTCREYMGAEIHLYNGTPPERDENGWVGLEPITDRDGTKISDKVLVHGLFGELFLMTVDRRMGDESFIAVTVREDGTPGGMMGHLKFGEDDRNCWVCTGLFNLRAVRKLELSTDG